MHLKRSFKEKAPNPIKSLGVIKTIDDSVKALEEENKGINTLLAMIRGKGLSLEQEEQLNRTLREATEVSGKIFNAIKGEG